MTMDETGWLIEENSNGMHPLYIALGPDPIQIVSRRRGRLTDYFNGKFSSPLASTKDANEALRFSRQADAEGFVRVFGRFMLCPEVREHCWPSAIASMPTVVTGEQQGWQPIESAPRLHKPVLISDPNWGVCEGMYNDGKWLLPSYNGSHPTAHPTHWQPLPEPPAQPGDV